MERKNITEQELLQRESRLVATIEEKLPDFARACQQNSEVVILHQDAFAADYQEEEYKLFGMAIKYAGLRRKEVHVVGKNRETLNRDSAVH